MTTLGATAADLLDMALVLSGWNDTARYRVGASDCQVLAQGRWLEHALRRGELEPSIKYCQHIPCIGELAGRWPGFARSVDTAVRLAESPSQDARLLARGLRNLEQAAHWFPASGSPLVARIQRRLREFLGPREPAPPRFELLDVRGQFTFTKPTTDAAGRVSHTARGWLGIPSRVCKFDRDSRAHRAINARFPDDHAGHLIARNFGAPADARNLEAQNAVMNSWGTYQDLEEDWEALLEQGCGIHVTVEVVCRPSAADEEDSGRADRRHARWKVVAPNGTTAENSQSFLDRPAPKESREQLRQDGKSIRKDFTSGIRLVPPINDN